jgi:hypothetical protein
MKFQRLQNKVLPTTGNFPRHKPTHELNMAFNIPYVFVFIARLRRQQVGVIRNDENAYIRNIGTGLAFHGGGERIRDLNSAAGRPTSVQASELPF